MNIQTAIQSPIFLTYAAAVGGLLVFAGVVLGILKLAGKHRELRSTPGKTWLREKWKARSISQAPF
jgi:hypothetical protein